MLPQLALSDNLLEEKMGRKKAASANVTVPSPINLSGMDVDKQLVNHVFNQGLTLISNLVRLTGGLLNVCCHCGYSKFFFCIDR